MRTRSLLLQVVIACAILSIHVRAARAQEAAPPPSVAPADPSTPTGDQGDILDLSGQEMVAPTAPAAEASETAVQASPAASSLPSPALRAIEPPPVSPAVRANAVQLSLFGLSGGRFRLNYERLLHEHHGLVIEGILNPNLLDRLSPDTDDASDPKRFFGYGAGAGYRWHWRGERGGFVSAMVALEHGSGSLPVLGDPDIRWSGARTVLSLTPGVGGRWIWGSGFSMVLRGGIGYAHDWIDHDPGLAKKAVDQYKNQFLNIEGELSLGYVF